MVKSAVQVIVLALITYVTSCQSKPDYDQIRMEILDHHQNN